MAKKVGGQLTKDEIRDHIVRHLYDLHENAKGLSGISVGISDLRKAMKTFGISGAEVISNLDYLVQVGWVKEVSSSKTFKTPGGMLMESATKYFKISAQGINLFEQASSYKREERFTGINITNIHGVTVIGEGNVVNTQLADLSRALTKLEDAIKSTGELTDVERLNVLSDLATIQSQLQKPDPDKGIVQSAWSGIEKVANVGQIGEIVAKIAPVILSFMGAG